MVWVNLHLNSDQVVRINFDKVCAYWKYSDGKTIIQLSGGDDNYIEVKETPEEIDRKISLLFR